MVAKLLVAFFFTNVTFASSYHSFTHCHQLCRVCTMWFIIALPSTNGIQCKTTLSQNSVNFNNLESFW